jgi:hypothetical protein
MPIDMNLPVILKTELNLDAQESFGLDEMYLPTHQLRIGAVLTSS